MIYFKQHIELIGVLNSNKKYESENRVIISYYLFDNEAAEEYANSTNYTLEELMTESIVVETFSKDKFLMEFGIEKNIRHDFICSRIYPAHRNSNPIIVDFYREKSREAGYLCILRLEENYSAITVYETSDEKIYTTLPEELALTSTLFAFNQEFLNEVKIFNHNEISEYFEKVVALNLQSNPGHYIQDELTFTVNLQHLYRYLAERETACPRILFNQGLGFNALKGFPAECQTTSFSSREKLLEEIKNGNYWIIYPISYKYIALKGYNTISEVCQSVNGRRLQINDRHEIFEYTLGFRKEARNGLYFEITPCEIYDLNESLTRMYDQRTGRKTKFAPILDFTIEDGRERDRNYEISLLKECSAVFGCNIKSTIDMRLDEKCDQLQTAKFGLYPWGSGSSPFSHIINKLTFVHAPFVAVREPSPCWPARTSVGMYHEEYNIVQLCKSEWIDECIYISDEKYKLNIDFVAGLIVSYLIKTT